MNLKYQLRYGMKRLNYLMDNILYFEYIFKIHETVTDNPSIRMYVNRIQNRITFKIKTGYYLEILTTQTMKLLQSAISKIIKDENGENVPRLEIM